MLIDWFTVGAQVLNFIVLVWLMKRFLYQPVLNAVDAREKRIADELAHADKVSEEASKAKASYESKNLEFDQQRDQLLADAKESADAERQRLLETARQAAELLEDKRQQALQKKMQALAQSIRATTQKEVFAMAKNALRDLAAVEIEPEMVTVFLKRLRAMDSEQKVEFEAALKGKQISVVSSSDLSSEMQRTVEDAIHELAGQDVQLQFEQSAELIGGIELTTGGFKIGWSVAEYLYALEDTLSELISSTVNILPSGPEQDSGEGAKQ